MEFRLGYPRNGWLEFTVTCGHAVDEFDGLEVSWAPNNYVQDLAEAVAGVLETGEAQKVNLDLEPGNLTIRILRRDGAFVFLVDTEQRRVPGPPPSDWWSRTGDGIIWVWRALRGKPQKLPWEPVGQAIDILFEAEGSAEEILVPIADAIVEFTSRRPHMIWLVVEQWAIDRMTRAIAAHRASATASTTD